MITADSSKAIILFFIRDTLHSAWLSAVIPCQNMGVTRMDLSIDLMFSLKLLQLLSELSIMGPKSADFFIEYSKET